MSEKQKTYQSSVKVNTLTKAIGLQKAVKFAAVEGIETSQSAHRIAKKAASGGQSGDAYRAAITMAYKKS
ncbi:hypothetical protein AAFN47_23570 [Hoeflea sp. CAU 1731]